MYGADLGDDWSAISVSNLDNYPVFKLWSVWGLARAAEERELFQGRVPEALRKMETFPTKCIGIAAQDDTPDLSRTAGVLHTAFGMDPDSITLQDRKEVPSLHPLACCVHVSISSLDSLLMPFPIATSPVHTLLTNGLPHPTGGLLSKRRFARC